MNCHKAEELLNPWIDGELPHEECAALENHLSDCAECRSLADRLRTQDTELQAAFRAQRQAALQVSSRVLAAFDQQSQVAMPQIPPARFGWGALLLATAAGFLLAVALFQPWRQRAAKIERPEMVQTPQAAPPIAKLVVATGAVEMRVPSANEWQACSDLKAFHCPSRSEVRTGKDVRCELQTTDGCIIRLNGDTEIALASPTSVTIRRGQIWCKSPQNVSLQIVAPQTEAPANSAASPWSFTCPSSACVLTANQPGGEMQVLTSAGETELKTALERQRLRPGECASIVDGQIVCAPEAADPLLAAAWVNTLLVHKGNDDEELAQRIGEMLSHAGDSSAARLYQQEIRGLGEHAVPSLLRIVQATPSRDPRRLTAMRLLSDLAPSWSVPKLIELLADDDGEIRVLAATALQRLTGQNQGLAPAQWRNDDEARAATLELWRQWWQASAEQYSPAPTRPERL